jgi:DNA polymerase-3 subunit alpha
MSHKHEITGFEHIHCHVTEGSLLDGFAFVSEYAERLPKINQRFLTITDHGMMSAVPKQIAECEKRNINPIFGCELYIQPLQPYVEYGQSTSDVVKDWTPELKKKLRKSNHLLAIVKNQTGYQNLVQLTSWAWLHGFYSRPRINYEQLNKHKEGIIFTSGCVNGEIGWAWTQQGKEAAEEVLKIYTKMFPEDFYLELQMLDFKPQRGYDRFLIQMAQKYNLPLVLSQDCHYCNKEDSHYQRLMLMVEKKSTLAEINQAIAEGKEDELFELQDTNLWLKSEEELNRKWEEDYFDIIDYEVFKEAKRNAVKICEMAKGVQLDRSIKLPEIPHENEQLRQFIEEGFKKRGLPETLEYRGRLEEEYQLVVEKKFASYFLIEKEMVDAARDNLRRILGWGEPWMAVGPGRGSGPGFLINYCLGITNIDPVKHELLSSRFLSRARGGRQMKLRLDGKPIYVKPVEVDNSCPF